MSIPYLVHKEDAEAYDHCVRARQEIFLNAKKWLKTANVVPLDRRDDPAQPFYDQPEIMSKFEKIYNDEKKLRIITAFQTQPKDLQNYFTYYRGMRWDDADECEMMGTALNGIKACKEIMRNK